MYPVNMIRYKGNNLYSNQHRTPKKGALYIYDNCLANHSDMNGSSSCSPLVLVWRKKSKPYGFGPDFRCLRSSLPPSLPLLSLENDGRSPPGRLSSLSRKEIGRASCRE